MKTGATSLELDVTYSFSGDGNDVELASVCLGERRLPKALGERLIEWLGGKAQNQLVDEAWANAEEETDGKEYLDLGAFAFFNKPFKLEEIEDAVERAIARHDELAGIKQNEAAAKTEPPPNTGVSN